jgi:hypothetical protein
MSMMTPLKKRTLQPSCKKKVSIAESLPIPSKTLAVDPIPKPFLGTPKEEEIQSFGVSL